MEELKERWDGTYVPTRARSSGEHGKVFNVEVPLIWKVGLIGEYEIEAQKEGAKLGISSRILDYSVEGSLDHGYLNGWILMKPLPGVPLDEWIVNLSKEYDFEIPQNEFTEVITRFIKNYDNMIEKAREMSYSHGDMLMISNYIYDEFNNMVYLIDYGESYPLDSFVDPVLKVEVSNFLYYFTNSINRRLNVIDTLGKTLSKSDVINLLYKIYNKNLTAIPDSKWEHSSS